MVLALQDQESTALPMYEQQLQEANTGINNLLNAIQQGILTKSTKTRLEELEAARDELENKIALEKLAKPRVSEEQVRFFLQRFRALDIAKPEQRKTLIDVFLNAVYVFNDKIVISCNYKDGTKTINFSDMECALTQRASVPDSDLDCPVHQKNSHPLSGWLFFSRRRGLESSAKAPAGLSSSSAHTGRYLYLRRSPARRKRMRVPAGAPNQQNPNQFFPMGDGFGFCVFYRKQFFPNGMPCRPESKPRGPKKKKSK